MLLDPISEGPGITVFTEVGEDFRVLLVGRPPAEKAFGDIDLSHGSCTGTPAYVGSGGRVSVTLSRQ